MPAGPRYSDRQPEALKKIILALKDRDCAHFRTSVFAPPDSGNALVWLEAVKDPHNHNLWTLCQYDRMTIAGNGAPVNAKKTIMTGACFFDALHVCAEFEMGRIGMAAGSFPDIETWPHYSAAAKDAGIPLDIDNLPLPAAHGEILGDGFFSDEARAIARRTADMKIEPVEPGSALEKFMIEARLAASEPQTLPSERLAVERGKILRDEKNLADSFGRARDMAETLYKTLKTVIDGNYERRSLAEEHQRRHPQSRYGDDPGKYHTAEGAAVGLAISGLFTLGIAPAVRFFQYRDNMSSEGLFNRKLGEFDGLLDQLPRNEKKTLLTDFRRAAAGAFHFEKAGAIYRQWEYNGRKNPKALATAVREIETGARIMNLPEEARESMKLAYAKGQVKEKAFFLEDVYKKLRAIKPELPQSSWDYSHRRYY